jgi:hypothetical protein
VEDKPAETPKTEQGTRKFRIWRIVGIGLLILLTLLAGLSTWIINDVERIRKLAELTLSELTGRTLSIEGEFDFELGKLITVRGTQLRWQNPEWSTAPYMLEIGAFEVILDSGSLIGDAALITDAQVSDATLLFEWTAADQFNWQFGADDNSIEGEPPQPLPLLLDRAQLKNVTLSFSHPNLTKPLVLVVASAVHQQDADKRLVLDAQVMLQGRPLQLSGNIGPFPQLAVAGAVNFDLNAVGELAELSATGDFGWLAELQTPDFEIILKAPESRALFSRLSLPSISSGSIDLYTRVKMDDSEVLALLVGKLGNFDIDAQLNAASLTSFDGFTLAVDAAGPDASQVLKLAGMNNPPHTPIELEIKATRSEQGLQLSKLSLETSFVTVNATGAVNGLPDLHDFDLELDASGSDINYIADLFDLPATRELPFSLNADIAGNGAGIDDAITAHLEIGNTRISVTGVITENDAFVDSRFDYRVDAPDAVPLSKLIRLELVEKTAVALNGTARIKQNQLTLEKFNGTFENSIFSGAGVVNTADSNEVVDVNVQLSGPNFAKSLHRLLVAKDLPVPSVKYAASTKLHYNNRQLRVEEATAQIGQNKLGFDGDINLSLKSPSVIGQVSASGNNLAELASGLDIANIPAAKFSAGAALSIKGGSIALQNASAQLPNADIALDMVASGEDYADITFDLNAKGTNLANIVPASNAWIPPASPFSISARGSISTAVVDIDSGSAKLGGAEADFSGKIDLKPIFRLHKLDVHAAGERLADLGQFSDWELTTKPFALSAEFNATKSGGKAEGIVFTTGQTKLDGSVAIVHGADRPQFTVALTSEFFSLDDIRAVKKKSEPSIQKDSADAASDSQENPRVFSAEPLPFDLLDLVDGALRVELATLVVNQRRFNNTVADFSLDGGALKLNQLSANLPTGSFTAQGSVLPGIEGRHIDVIFKADQVPLELQPATPGERSQLPKLAVDVHLTATGETPQQLASTANGYVWALAGKGQMHKLQFNAIFNDFLTELFTQVNPFSQKKAYTTTDCQGYYMEIEDGLVRTSPAMVFQTKEVVIVAAGEINLATEQINLTFRTTPRKGIGFSVNNIVNPFTKFGGTLSKPRITLDTSGAFVEGSAAFATGGLSIFAKGLWNRLISNKEICQKVAERALKERMQRDPNDAPDLDALLAGTRAVSVE